jgi:hypothetical protein
MVGMVLRNGWIAIMFRTMPRWLLSRKGKILFTVAIVGLCVILFNLACQIFLDGATVTSAAGSKGVKDNVYHYIPDEVSMVLRQVTATLSPAEVERKKRVEAFSRIMRKQVGLCLVFFFFFSKLNL